MRNWLWRYRVPLALLALLPTYAAWQIADLRWGIPAEARAAATRDFHRGVRVMQTHGLVGNPRFEYKRLLRERYKVVLLSGGCMQYLPDAIYEENYNGQLQALLQKEYGRDIFEECSDEADKNKAKDMFGAAASDTN